MTHLSREKLVAEAIIELTKQLQKIAAQSSLTALETLYILQVVAYQIMKKALMK